MMLERAQIIYYKLVWLLFCTPTNLTRSYSDCLFNNIIAHDSIV